MEWIKHHPYLAGGLALGLLILFFVFRGRSSNTTAAGATVQQGPSPALQAAQLQASTQLQGYQIAASAQSNQLSAQLAATQIKSNTDLQIAQLQQQAQLQNIVTSGQVQNAQTSAALQSVQAQIGGQVQLGQIQAQQNLGLAQVQGQTQLGIAGIQGDVMKAQYEASTQQAAITSAAQTAQAQAVADTQKQIANYQFQTQYANIWANAQTQQNAQNRSADIAYTQLVTQQQIAGGAQAVQEQAIQAQQNLGVAQQQTYQDYINQQGALASQYIGLQSQKYTDVTNLLASGQFNKGGEGGANQVQFGSSVFGTQPVPGVYGGGTSFGINIPGIGSLGVGSA